jgi:hypothetical protein
MKQLFLLFALLVSGVTYSHEVSENHIPNNEVTQYFGITNEINPRYIIPVCPIDNMGGYYLLLSKDEAEEYLLKLEKNRNALEKIFKASPKKEKIKYTFISKKYKKKLVVCFMNYNTAYYMEKKLHNVKLNVFNIDYSKEQRWNLETTNGISSLVSKTPINTVVDCTIQYEPNENKNCIMQVDKNGQLVLSKNRCDLYIKAVKDLLD